MSNLIPDFTEKYYDFELKFGRLFYLAPDCSLFCYESKTDKKTYQITGNVSKGDFENLYRKSLEDDKDYVLEYVKKNGKVLDDKQEVDEDLEVVY
ncbi:MAG: hypothetical protein J5710_03535 [Treponema sp.]|nr:hypothetical protein [Treponema sp.]MBR5645185.1 hypothetical protein [Treponema sp.]